MVSIIIPTLNEEENIADLIFYLHLHHYQKIPEIIVSDAGSKDATVQKAKAAGATVVVCPKKGRAAQLNYGASFASGSVLYFVHADTIPPKSFVADIEKATESGYSLGRYRTRFKSNNYLLKLNAFFTRFDLFMCYGGDQTFFITKELFTALGGFNEEMIIMEDYEFTDRARQKGNYKIIQKSVIISARKYENNTWWQVQRANYKAVTMYKKGMDQATIANTYKKNLRYR